MHAVKLLQKCLRSALEPMHARRRETLLGSVAALVQGRRLVLMDLARSWSGSERVAAPLKRIDRLLSNTHLAEECGSIYAAMGRWCLCQPQPVIIVDWSPVNRRGKHYLLRAALAVGGRALTLWERVTPTSECNAPQHEQALLHALKLMMPVGATPILVTDAGFKSPWFNAVTAMGWHFVGRLRGSVLVKPVGVADTPQQWLQCKHLHALSGPKARVLGAFQIVRSRPTECRLIVHATPPKGRVHRTLQGERCRAHYSRQNAQRHSEPWLLAASPDLDFLSTTQVIAIYARRMQIEQSFRDLKSHRFGVGFEDSLTRVGARLAILLMLHAMACFAAWIAARTASPQQYSAIEDRLVRPAHRSIISWHRAGWTLLQHDRWKPKPSEAKSRIRSLANAVLTS
jgi:Transposase DDE domain